MGQILLLRKNFKPIQLLQIPLSFLFGGSSVGTREGTLIAAVRTGFVVKFFVCHLTKPLDKLLKK